MLKICAQLEEGQEDVDVPEVLANYLQAFLLRYKNIIDLADSSEILQNEQFLSDQKKLSNLERELLTLHRRQRARFVAANTRKRHQQIEVSLDLMDEDMKQAHKRMRQ